MGQQNGASQQSQPAPAEPRPSDSVLNLLEDRAFALTLSSGLGVVRAMIDSPTGSQLNIAIPVYAARGGGYETGDPGRDVWSGYEGGAFSGRIRSRQLTSNVVAVVGMHRPQATVGAIRSYSEFFQSSANRVGVPVFVYSRRSNEYVIFEPGAASSVISADIF